MTVHGGKRGGFAFQVLGLPEVAWPPSKTQTLAGLAKASEPGDELCSVPSKGT